jgi:hypothetical protein
MIRLFHSADLESVNRWYAWRAERSGLPITMLPEIGIIEEDTAAGWLYRTDAPGAIAMLDSLRLQSSQAPLRARAAARCGRSPERLLQLASAGGVTHVMALCKSRGIERLACMPSTDGAAPDRASTRWPERS